MIGFIIIFCRTMLYIIRINFSRIEVARDDDFVFHRRRLLKWPAVKWVCARSIWAPRPVKINELMRLSGPFGRMLLVDNAWSWLVQLNCRLEPSAFHTLSGFITSPGWMTSRNPLFPTGSSRYNESITHHREVAYLEAIFKCGSFPISTQIGLNSINCKI